MFLQISDNNLDSIDQVYEFLCVDFAPASSNAYRRLIAAVWFMKKLGIKYEINRVRNYLNNQSLEALPLSNKYLAYPGAAENLVGKANESRKYHYAAIIALQFLGATLALQPGVTHRPNILDAEC